MQIYERLGVRPIINALGTVTALGGSIMDPEVIEAMAQASRSFVDLHRLHARAGESIARLMGAPAACVTSGASAGLTIAAAACMAGTDPQRVAQLPDTSGLRDEGLILRAHRNRYDQAVRLSGMRLKDVGEPASADLADIEAVISENTAAFIYLAESESAPGSLPLDEIAATLAARQVPLIVDAAAELPPRSNVARYLELGAAAVVLSGGKQIRGPQSSGVVLGTEELIRACIANAFPNHSIGRGMKTDKETIVGLLTAVERFVTRDEAAEYARWEQMTARVVTELNGAAGLTARRGFPSPPGIQPHTIPRAYVRNSGCSAEDLQHRLLHGGPAVAVGVEADEIVINPQCISPDQLSILISAISATVKERS